MTGRPEVGGSANFLEQVRIFMVFQLKGGGGDEMWKGRAGVKRQVGGSDWMGLRPEVT